MFVRRVSRRAGGARLHGHTAGIDQQQKAVIGLQKRWPGAVCDESDRTPTSPIFMHVNCGRGSVLLWRCTIRYVTYFRFCEWRRICSWANVARRRRPAEAQWTRCLRVVHGLGWVGSTAAKVLKICWLSELLLRTFLTFLWTACFWMT